VDEPESRSLASAVAAWPSRTSSLVAAVEVTRVARRHPDPAVVRRAGQVLEGIVFLAFDTAIAEAAKQIAPPILGSIDAIHLATALSLGDDLGGFVCYDRRLAEAAKAAGLPLLAPS
jgi:predicted nucleic acid-binding protein